MSDSGLDARLSRIDGELQNLAMETSRVLAATSTTASAINSAERNLGGQLDELRAAQRRTHNEVVRLHETFTGFVEQDRRDKQRLFAHSALLAVRSEIETKYGQYEVVRRNVHGMLLALDGGLAQDATMQLIAELQSINAPNYWLASAMNALAAWIRDDHGAAERALLHGSTLSRTKTALFFGLVNARFGRFDATDQWFREYLNDQNPEELSRELTVVLDAAMLGLLGEHTYERVERQCQAWFEKLSAREDVVAQQIARWREEIARRREPSSGPAQTALNRQCPVLANASPDWSRISDSYRLATAFKHMNAVLADRLQQQQQADPTAWQVRIDGVLDDLQVIPEEGEAKLRLEEAHFERIIRYEGDTAAADRAKAAEAPLDEPLVDLLTFLSNAASSPPDDAPVQTTQLALHLAAPWISDAATGIVAETRGLSTAPVTIEIDDWNGQLGADEVDALDENFVTMIDDQTRKNVARARSVWPWLFALAGAVAFLGYMMRVLLTARAFQPWTIGITAACFLVLTVFAIRRRLGIPQRVRNAKQQGEQRRAAGLATLHEAAADRDRLLAAFIARMSEADLLEEFLSSIELPDRPPGVSERESGAGLSPADLGADADVSPRRPRGFGRLPTPFTLPEWSLEPVGTDRG